MYIYVSPCNELLRGSFTVRAFIKDRNGKKNFDLMHLLQELNPENNKINHPTQWKINFRTKKFFFRMLTKQKDE
jgi:hypothetical protein